MAEETVTFNLELNVEQCLSNVRQLETLLYRSIALIRRLGLPEDVNRAIYLIQRITMTIRMMHTALILLEAASGPVGWATALLGLGTAAASLGDMFYDDSRGT